MLEDEFWEVVSYTLGCSSVLIWLCAQLPQIRKNWRRKSVEGVSTGFLAAWVLGDVSNLAGCLLTGQLYVQIALAAYYCLIDVVLMTQFVIYRPRPVLLDALDPADSGELLSPDNSNHAPKKRTQSALSVACGKLVSVVTLSGLIKSTAALPLPTGAEDAEPGLGPDWARHLGMVVAYFSMLMYLMSRLPQITHNFQRKSTTGISMLLFMSAFMGNLTYTLSILLAPQSMGRDADRRAFLLNEFPYLLGAAGTMLFDCIILAQWYWYHRVTAHRRRSTQPYDRIQRPYLGESAASSAASTPPPPSNQLNLTYYVPLNVDPVYTGTRRMTGQSWRQHAPRRPSNYGSINNESAVLDI